MAAYFDDDESEEDDGFLAADKLLEDMRRLRAQVSTAVEDVTGREQSANEAASQLHEKLNLTAVDIIAGVVSGEGDAAASPSSVPLEDGDAREAHWRPDAVIVQPAAAMASVPAAVALSPSAPAAAAAPAAASARRRFTVQQERQKPDSGVESVVNDISRLVGKPLLAVDDGECSSATRTAGGVARRSGLGSGSHIAVRGAASRGAGSRLPTGK